MFVQGKVFSGSGEGAKFIQLSWVKNQITQKLGFTPYPGTLNIKLTEDSINIKELLKKAKATEISPAEGFRHGKCFEAYFMNGLKCAIVIPDVMNYPANIIEIIAPINLRAKFQLKDGDAVKVKIIL
jgi:riboflavin kinase